MRHDVGSAPTGRGTMSIAVRIALAVLLASAALLVGCAASPQPQATWPPSGDGLTTFYYFGDPG